MLERLRWQLTMWFVGLSVCLYLALSVAVVLVFNSGLNVVIDQELRGLSREVRPSIDYSKPIPTLKNSVWASNINKRDIRLLATVQIFGPDGRLMESYGPPGVSALSTGRLQKDASGSILSVESRFRELKVDENLVGYLQIQQSTKGRDDAMEQLILTIIGLAPFLIAALGGCGYIFAGKALRPTEQSLGLLRRFVADAGHELNTPITVIQASIETIEKKLNDADLDTETVQIIRRASDRMSALGRDLMLLAKLESPHLQSPIEAVRFDQVLDSVLDELGDAFTAKKIAVVRELASVRVMAHADSLRTLVSNLIENALRYTENGGTITVVLEEKGQLVSCSVQDTGVGIPSDSIPRIFERFYRVDKSRSRIAGGSGLGLAIAKAIVDSHEGSIRVESVLGKGSKFTVNLPALS